MSEERQALLSSREAAAYLGVNVKTLRRWADQEYIPHIRTPGAHGRRLFDSRALDAFAESLRKGPEGKLAA